MMNVDEKPIKFDTFPRKVCGGDPKILGAAKCVTGSEKSITVVETIAANGAAGIPNFIFAAKQQKKDYDISEWYEDGDADWTFSEEGDVNEENWNPVTESIIRSVNLIRDSKKKSDEKKNEDGKEESKMAKKDAKKKDADKKQCATDTDAEVNETGAVNLDTEAKETGAADSGTEAKAAGTADSEIEAKETGAADSDREMKETGRADLKAGEKKQSGGKKQKATENDDLDEKIKGWLDKDSAMTKN